MELAVINNHVCGLDELDRSWKNYGTFFGDGVYEVIRSYDGKIFALDDHMIRLNNSLKAIEITGVDVEILREQIVANFERSAIKNAKIYVQITRGCGERSHFLDPEMRPDILISISNLPDFTDQKENGIKVITYPDLRWKRCDIKSLNLLANVMATRAAQKADAQEAILITENSIITEGAGSSFFIFENETVFTTPLDENILPSISRKYISKCVEELELNFVQEHISVERAKKADEMFIGVTTRDVVGVVEFDKVPVSNSKPGKITKKIAQQFLTHTK